MHRVDPNLRRARRLPVLVVLAALVALVLAAPVGAQVDPASVADEVDRTGSFIQPDLDDDARQAIEEANERGVGVVLLSDPVPALDLSAQLGELLADRGSRYTTVLVVTGEGAAARSRTYDSGRIGALIDPGTPAFTAFAQGRRADGIRTFAEGLDDETVGAPVGETESDGVDVPWLTLLVVLALIGVGVGGLWLVRRQREQRREAARVEAQRSEVGQQLRNNADRIIHLGDVVVARGDAELIDLYERASGTYRDVSQSLDSAHSPDAVQRLDDRLDEAEWQLEVIEARLAGKTPPPPPTGGDAGDAPPVATPPAPPASTDG